MSVAEARMQSVPLFEVRTLGEVRRTSQRLSAGDRVEVGFSLANDLVVRDRRIGDNRVAFRIAANAAVVEVIEGRALLLGHEVVGPGQIILPPYVPLHLGDLTLAYGECDHPRWLEADDLLRAYLSQTAVTPEARQSQGIVRRLARGGAHLTARLPARGLAAALIVLTAVIAITVLLSPLRAHRETQTPVERIVPLLRQAGFGDLKVQSSPGREPVISGDLPNDLAVARLNSVLFSSGVHARLAVSTGEGLARRVEDLFRSGGVTASARIGSPGVVVLAVDPAADSLRVDQLARQARLEVAGVRGLRFEPAVAEPESARPPIKIAEVVSGADGFIGLSDGGKYFVGATLPTGQTIVAIGDHSASLEKDGVLTQLTY